MAEETKKESNVDRTSITLPKGTLEKARAVGINVSATASIAIRKAIDALGGSK